MPKTVAVIRGGKFYRVGEDGVLRDTLGVAYEPDGSTIGGVVVKNYEHVAHSLPRWNPEDHPGEPCPYPHLKGNKAAFQSRREVESFQAKYPQYGWDQGE
jgi:hypothetical protein